jgi:hypothetical protein
MLGLAGSASTFFSLRASRSHCIYFVTEFLQWKTTAAYPVPRIYSDLDS